MYYITKYTFGYSKLYEEMTKKKGSGEHGEHPLLPCKESHVYKVEKNEHAVDDDGKVYEI